VKRFRTAAVEGRTFSVTCAERTRRGKKLKSRVGGEKHATSHVVVESNARRHRRYTVVVGPIKPACACASYLRSYIYTRALEILCARYYYYYARERTEMKYRIACVVFIIILYFVSREPQHVWKSATRADHDENATFGRIVRHTVQRECSSRYSYSSARAKRTIIVRTYLGSRFGTCIDIHVYTQSVP